ncbi:hypothetical protein [Pelagicoccus albus]|uniref:Uncharacterized protein n=1 Tax=Pelagicoccus albus TaxID=415222 RepID=A0A7X1B5K0_9BACT|nr:hypothetical protein [Pelagicoccus albus]MBC2604800.1 hypothetical protein [Pelagicoccus albus]
MMNLETILSLDSAIRYAATNLNGKVSAKSKDSSPNQSSGETDKYEELLVNPTILDLTQRRGDLDCGGLDYLLVAYGNFYQFVQKLKDGHISVCISKDADPIPVANKVRIWLHQNRS